MLLHDWDPPSTQITQNNQMLLEYPRGTNTTTCISHTVSVQNPVRGLW